MPAHKNFPLGVPRLNNPGDSLVMSVTAFASEKAKIFWGPGQTSRWDGFDYSPPQNWPRKGLVYRLPHSCRIFWESTDLDAEALAVGGYSGGYTWAIHFDDFDFHDHYSGTGIFPGDVSTVSPFGGTPEKTTYATKFHTIIGPTVWDDGFGIFTATGFADNNYEPKFFVPPFSKVDYTNAGSITIGAITIAYDLMANGFSPAEPDPGSEFTVPPFIVSVPDGPNSVGLFVHDTGRYYVDGAYLNTGSIFTIPSNPFGIPVGWKRPTANDKTFRDSTLQDGFNQIQHFYKNSTYPYVDIFHTYAPASGVNDFAYLALVPQDLSEPTNYMTSCSLIIIYLAKPHNFPNGSLVNQLMEQFDKFDRFRVVLYVDYAWMVDGGELDTGVADGVVEAAQALCAGLSAYGWFFGGSTIGGSTGPHGLVGPDGISGDWNLPPDAQTGALNGNLLDNIASQIAAFFPLDTPGITPNTFDPPLPLPPDDTSPLGNPAPKPFNDSDDGTSHNPNGI